MSENIDWGLYYYPLIETLHYYLEDDWSSELDSEILYDWMIHNISDIVEKIKTYEEDGDEFDYWITDLGDKLDEYYEMKLDGGKVDEYGNFYSTLTDTLYPLIENKRKDLSGFIETSCKRDLRNVRIDTILEK